MKRVVIILIAAALAFAPLKAEAKTVTKYTTQTVALKEQANTKSKTLYKVKAVTALKVDKVGKTWTRAQYKGKTVYVQTKYTHAVKPVDKWRGKTFKRKGRGRWNGWSWTWYSQRRLPGRGLKIPGRHLDKKRGFVLDKDGYIVLASGRQNKKKRLIVPTPFGRYGKVYDTNGKWNSKWFDVYVNW